MSYDISLIDPVTKEVLHADEKHHLTGGTYAIGGTTALELNVTYNYSEILHKVLGEGGIRSLYGITGALAINMIKNAIDQLGDDVDPDYWKATEGNVKQALFKLLALCRMRPDGVIQGD
jgi:hypothetical protein